MNAQDAITLHTQFLELKELVQQKIPKQITLPHPWRTDSRMTYELTGITLEDLLAHYRSYIGCGDYEYTSEHIDLSTLLGASS